MAQQKLTIKQLYDIVKEGFDNIESTLNSLSETNMKTNEDICKMRNQIISNLVENNKKLQKKDSYKG